MKLKAYWIEATELQDYLDKYQERIKFVNICTLYLPGYAPGKLLLIIDEA